MTDNSVIKAAYRRFEAGELPQFETTPDESEITAGYGVCGEDGRFEFPLVVDQNSLEIIPRIRTKCGRLEEFNTKAQEQRLCIPHPNEKLLGTAPDPAHLALEVLNSIASGEAFQEMRFAEDDDVEYHLRRERKVKLLAHKAVEEYSKVKKK